MVKGGEKHRCHTVQVFQGLKVIFFPSRNQGHFGIQTVVRQDDFNLGRSMTDLIRR
jgi:hypothetical protein